MRSMRRALDERALANAARRVALQARQCQRLQQARSIASYSPFDGELSPASIVPSTARIFLPRITHYTRGEMRFYAAKSLHKNRYGITEPSPGLPPVKINTLDVILVPLVAFDRSGNRLGMGAGFYDRALAPLRHQESTRPYLIGIAHHFQEVKMISPEPWDARLDAILTDRNFIQID